MNGKRRQATLRIVACSMASDIVVPLLVDLVVPCVLPPPEFPGLEHMHAGNAHPVITIRKHFGRRTSDQPGRRCLSHNGEGALCHSSLALWPPAKSRDGISPSSRYVSGLRAGSR